MKTSIIIIIISIIRFLSCNKEYSPSQDDYRDSSLVGTWINSDSIIFVYTKEDHYGVEAIVKGKYSNLDGIWKISKQIESDPPVGQIFIRSINKSLSNRVWENIDEYFYSVNYDIVFKKQKQMTTYYTLVKYKYQLIFDEPDYVGIDLLK